MLSELQELSAEDEVTNSVINSEDSLWQSKNDIIR